MPLPRDPYVVISEQLIARAEGELAEVEQQITDLDQKKRDIKQNISDNQTALDHYLAWQKQPTEATE